MFTIFNIYTHFYFIPNFTKCHLEIKVLSGEEGKSAKFFSPLYWADLSNDDPPLYGGVVQKYYMCVELYNYPTDLRSLTKGRGEVMYIFERYDEAPSDV